MLGVTNSVLKSLFRLVILEEGTPNNERGYLKFKQQLNSTQNSRLSLITRTGDLFYAATVYLGGYQKSTKLHILDHILGI